MGLKQLIQRKQFFNRDAVAFKLTLPEEPHIYSLRLDIGRRYYSVQFFRNMKFKSILKCHFQAYSKHITPVVIVVRFFVSPPSSQKITKAELKSERVPATLAYEVCDYLLSFLEMLHHVLFASYRQVVKIDVMKFYSDNPRTEFQFMSWENFVTIQKLSSIVKNDCDKNQP